jgi:hypothetical protein
MRGLSRRRKRFDPDLAKSPPALARNCNAAVGVALHGKRRLPLT